MLVQCLYTIDLYSLITQGKVLRHLAVDLSVGDYTNGIYPALVMGMTFLWDINQSPK